MSGLSLMSAPIFSKISHTYTLHMYAFRLLVLSCLLGLLILFMTPSILLTKGMSFPLKNSNPYNWINVLSAMNI